MVSRLQTLVDPGASRGIRGAEASELQAEVQRNCLAKSGTTAKCLGLANIAAAGCGISTESSANEIQQDGRRWDDWDDGDNFRRGRHAASRVCDLTHFHFAALNFEG